MEEHSAFEVKMLKITMVCVDIMMIIMMLISPSILTLVFMGIFGLLTWMTFRYAYDSMITPSFSPIPTPPRELYDPEYKMMMMMDRLSDEDLTDDDEYEDEGGVEYDFAYQVKIFGPLSNFSQIESEINEWLLDNMDEIQGVEHQLVALPEVGTMMVFTSYMQMITKVPEGSDVD